MHIYRVVYSRMGAMSSLMVQADTPREAADRAKRRLSLLSDPCIITDIKRESLQGCPA